MRLGDWSGDQIEDISVEEKELQAFKNGEGGIRTLGTVLRFVQQISNLPLSTTQPPLQTIWKYIITDIVDRKSFKARELIDNLRLRLRYAKTQSGRLPHYKTLHCSVGIAQNYQGSINLVSLENKREKTAPPNFLSHACAYLLMARAKHASSPPTR
jgi:hypothetical protein